MRDIYLYGELADKFISKVSLNVSSIPEAMRALEANFKGFRDYILLYTPGFHVRVGDVHRTTEEIDLPLGKKDTDIHIIPVISGSGKILPIILGAVLIWATGGLASIGMGSGITALGAGGSMASIGAALGSIGMGLVLSGISAILFAPPKPADTNKEENTPNKYFNGPVNTIEQGNPVPIGYGELIVGSAVISAGLTIDNSESIAHAKWLFTEVDKDGWTLSSAGIYYNTITKITWNSNTGLYSHSTTKNVDPSFFGISCTTDILNIETCTRVNSEFYEEIVARPPSTQAYTYTFNPTTGIFKRIAPTCVLEFNPLIADYSESTYCAGSAVMPEEWGT